jgi:hypothetical protein
VSQLPGAFSVIPVPEACSVNRTPDPAGVFSDMIALSKLR